MSLLVLVLPFLLLAFLGVGVWRYMARARANGRNLSTIEFSVLVVGAGVVFYVILRFIPAPSS